MKRNLFIFILIFFININFSYSNAVSENYAALKTPLDSIAYALGQNYYEMLKQNEIDIDFNIFYNALNDAKEGKAKFSKEFEEQQIQRLNEMLRAKNKGKIPKITFKPSKGTELTSDIVNSILKENGLTRNDIFECIIDNSVTSIGTEAFAQLPNLKKVIFPAKSNLKYIGNHCFIKTSIEEISLPESLEELKDNAFYDCSKLKKIIFHKNCNVHSLGSNHSMSVDDANAYLKYPNSSGISVQEIVLPKNIKVLYSGAFSSYKCNVKKIIFQSSEPPELETYFIDLKEYFRSNKVLTIKVPKGSKKNYKTILDVIIKKQANKYNYSYLVISNLIKIVE